MEPEMKELLTRGIEALENLAKEPEIQIPAFPAVCPHCEEMNPVVQVAESEAAGKLGEYVIKAKCMMCNHTFYALPMQWICVGSVEEAQEADKERAEHSGYNS